jgi:glycosyltransferase involved in cell wall biosynthesis
MTVEERMTKPRQGSLINTALAVATGDIIAYLCDDDIAAPGWYDALRAAWDANPKLMLVRGTWRQFTHGEPPREDDPRCKMDSRQMTAGNFAHHISAITERGAAWPTTALNCLDHGFLCSLHAVGVDQFTAVPVGFAGWRRDHPKVNLNWSDGWNHRPGFAEVLAAGYLE